MTLLVEVKEKCKQIYANYAYVILPVLKFIVAVSVFFSIHSTLNFSETTDNIFLLLIMALVCCVLPMGVTVLFGIGLIVLQCYSVGLEVAGFAIALFLLLFIFYVRFTPDDAIVLLLTPLAFLLQIPCVIPITYGLTKKPATALSTGCGVIVYYFIMLVQQKAPVFQATSAEELNINKNIQTLIDSMLNNTDLLVNLVAFVAVMLTVYLIRRLSVDYARQIAIFTGAVMYIIIWVLAAMLMDVVCMYVPLIVGTIVAVIIAEIFTFFRFGLDYSRTEYHQFEDDDYFYYVKAIPKVKITEKNVTVKRINEKEPEVVVEDVRVYKTKSKTKAEEPTGAASGSSVSNHTMAYTPISREAKKENEKEILKKDTPKKELHGEDDFRKVVPVKAVSVEDDFVKIAPAKETSVKDDFVKIAPVKETSVKDDFVKIAPAKETSVKDDFVKIAPTKETSVKDDFVKIAPAKETSVKDDFAKITLAKDDSVKNDFVELAPVKELSLEDDVQVVPVEKFSVKEELKEAETKIFGQVSVEKTAGKEEMNDIDFQKKLEKSLHDL